MKLELDYFNLINDIKDIIYTRLRDTGHVATGAGLDSLETKYETDYVAVIGNFYLNYLQKGTPPHNVPYQAIYDWVKSKGIASDDKESRQIAGAITHSIRAKGTKAYQAGGENIWSEEVKDLLDNHLNEYMKYERL